MSAGSQLDARDLWDRIDEILDARRDPGRDPAVARALAASVADREAFERLAGSLARVDGPRRRRRLLAAAALAGFVGIAGSLLLVLRDGARAPDAARRTPRIQFELTVATARDGALRALRFDGDRLATDRTRRLPIEGGAASAGLLEVSRRGGAHP